MDTQTMQRQVTGRGYLAAALGSVAGMLAGAASMVGFAAVVAAVSGMFDCEGLECLGWILLLMAGMLVGAFGGAIAGAAVGLRIRGHDRVGRTVLVMLPLLLATMIAGAFSGGILLPFAAPGAALLARRIVVGRATRDGGGTDMTGTTFETTAPAPPPVPPRTRTTLRNGNGPLSRRAGAMWVAGTGAALLVIAAGLFVAVRWNDLPDEGKLAIVLGLTGAFVLTGHALRPTLPVTGSVLFHLGAFLLPVDLAGLNLRLGLSWQELLLAEGVLGIVAYAGLALVSGSVVLSRAASASVVVAAFGIGATTLVPAPVALVLAALVFSAVYQRAMTPIVWAGIAGFTPLLTTAVGGIIGLPEALIDLGLPSAQAPLPALVTGLAAAVVIGRAAELRRDVGLAFVAFGAVASSGIVAWAGASIDRDLLLLALPSVFVVVGLGALVSRRDEFWATPTAGLALGVEALAAVATLQVSVFLVAAPLVGRDMIARPMEGLAVGILALGWIVAGARRTGPRIVSFDDGDWRFAVVPAAVAVPVAVLIGTGSPVATAFAAVAVGAALLLVGHVVFDVCAAVAVVYGSVVAWDDPAFAALAAFAGTVVLVAGGVHRMASGSKVLAQVFVASATWTLAFAAGMSTVPLEQEFGASAGRVLVTVGFAATAWSIAQLVGRTDFELGQIPRFAMLVAVIPALVMTPDERIVVAGALTALLAVDAITMRDRSIAFAAVIPAQALVVDGAILLGLDHHWAGVAAGVSAIAWAAGAMVSRRYRDPLAVGAGLASVLGIALAASDPAALGAVLIVTGGLVIGAGMALRSAESVHVGALVAIGGVWLDLAHANVDASEAYVVPVALHLAVTGAWLRRHRVVSSWIAYVPAIAMLGLTALVERVSGGAGWHAIVAGGVAVAAVAAGGSRRLGGPLFAGTLLLAAVVVHESLGVVAGVPTWAWLALGGSALLGAGVAIERAQASPAELGRRMVDVVARTFD